MAYENTLEVWYGGLSSPVQSVLNFRNAYDTVNGWLKWAAGDPNGLVDYAQKYVDLGQDLFGLSDDIGATASSLASWSGPAHSQFTQAIDDYIGKVRNLAPAIQATQEVLVAAAEGAVEVANGIIDVVKMFIEFLVSSLAVSLALSVLSFGASVAAWIAANLAKALQLIARVTTMLEKFASFLIKLAQILTKVAEILKKIQSLLLLVKDVFKAVSAIKPWDGLAAFGAAKAIGIPISMATKAATNVLLPDGVSMPAGFGEGRDAWDSFGNAADKAQEAQDIVDANKPTSGESPATYTV